RPRDGDQPLGGHVHGQAVTPVVAGDLHYPHFPAPVNLRATRAIVRRPARAGNPPAATGWPAAGSRCRTVIPLRPHVFSCAVAAAGHCPPDVVPPIKDQAAKLRHMSGTDFYYEPQTDLAQRLAESAPGPTAKRVFFTNSGAEALEAALKLARFHTGRSRIIAFLGAFHGRTYGAMSLSGSKLVHRRGFSPLVPDIHHVPFPKECSHDPGTTCSVVRDVEQLMHRVAPPDEVAPIFMEPIQG